jgi:superfamily II DNA or RNA helicase
MTDVHIEKINEVHVRVNAEPHIKMEMRERFTFEVPGAKFMPSVKNKVWDGKIRLLNTMTGLIYAGLVPHIIKFCEDSRYSVSVDPELKPTEPFDENTGYDLAEDFDTPFPPRDYQNDAVAKAIHRGRGLFLSPTASGKSFIIYLIARHFVQNDSKRVLIVVPTTSLVSQMASDFLEYNKNRPLDIHKIMAGADKTVDADYTVTTWQSIHKMPKTWFDSFDVVIGDEAHLFKAKSLTSIMERMPDVKYRFGFTGTLDDSLTNKMVLEGLFGSVTTVTQTKRLIDDRTLAEFDIKALVLKYPDHIRKANKGKTYQEEIDWIVQNEERNKFIRNLAWKLPGNTLILFQYVDKHGKVLYPMLHPHIEKTVHFVHGGIKAEEREKIRQAVDVPNKTTVLLWFGENKLELDEDEKVVLTDGRVKIASEITEDDDISNSWIKSRFNKTGMDNV